ncbi:MAG: NPCBM/NEW2 domain-containing protein [Armatimonadota bacterium]
MLGHRIVVLSLILASSLVVMNSHADASSSLKVAGGNIQSGILVVKHADIYIPVSIKSPRFAIDDQVVGGILPLSVKGELQSGKPVEITYPSTAVGSGNIEVLQYLQWSAKESVIRKWAKYRVSGASGVIREVILDDISLSNYKINLLAKQPFFHPTHSYPVFMDGSFAGIEFPMASTRISDGHVILAHKPGVRLQSGIWYETRKAVYGFTGKGNEWQGFCDYIDANRPEPRGSFTIYDNWLSTANSYTEKEMLDLMHLLDDKLYKRNGVSIDAFRLVCTWSNPQSIWKVDKTRLPDGLANFRKVVEDMGSHMGLWISPASCYPFAQDGEWAGKNGYETFTVTSGPNTFHHTCIAGPVFHNEFKNNLIDLVKTYDIRHIQFDGYRFECTESNHGHEPGELSAEAVASGMTDVFQSLREVSPNIYLHGAYGGNPSPWWLFYINAFLVYYGDDAPFGRIPAPNYRESFTSGRDQANLQASYHCPAPVPAQDVYGLYDHSPTPFVNDAVMAVMRGHMTNSIIVNPKFKDDQGWDKIAAVTKWARKNAPVLKNTLPLLPISWQDGKCPVLTPVAPMPREPYGYAHCDGNSGLVILRNPWIVPSTYSLKLDDSINLSPKASGLSALSVYPEARLYASNLHYGDLIQVPLAPYETIVLSIGPKQKTVQIPNVSEAVTKQVDFKVSRKDVYRVKFEGPSAKDMPDAISSVGDSSSALKVSMGSVVDIDAPGAELLVLLEDNKAVVDPVYSISVNGSAVPVTYSDSEFDFAATGSPRPERWLFLRAPLVKGRNMVSLDLMTRNETPKVSVWVLASKPGEVKASDYPNALPQPEIVYLDSANLLSQIDASDPSLSEISMQRPVEKIDGIYIDALDESAIVKDSSFYQKNANFLHETLSVYGRRYFRGLSTIAPSKIAVNLDGRYKRFQSWVGIDQGMASYDRSGVIFKVVVDGQERWKSSLITRHEAPEFADVDLTGAKTIELIVEDGLKKDPVYHSNWSNWGEARLLK